MFTSKVSAMARELGRPVKMLRDPGKLAGEAGQRVIVDLTLPGALEAAVAWKGLTGGQVVGFAGHVEVETLQKARAAGVDQVLAKGAFVNALADLL